jgi:hypothetical protein
MQHMVDSNKVNSIVEDYVKEAKSDYVGLWQIFIRVRHDFKLSNKNEIQEIVMKIVRGMLSAGLEAVTLESSGPGCIPWISQDQSYVLDRITSELNELGRSPSVGEIVWFNNPDAGVRS